MFEDEEAFEDEEDIEAVGSIPTIMVLSKPSVNVVEMNKQARHKLVSMAKEEEEFHPQSILVTGGAGFMLVKHSEDTEEEGFLKGH